MVIHRPLPAIVTSPYERKKNLGRERQPTNQTTDICLEFLIWLFGKLVLDDNKQKFFNYATQTEEPIQRLSNRGLNVLDVNLHHGGWLSTTY